MLREHYQYAVELQRLDGTALGQFPVAPDWEPACEWARFMALRDGRGDAQPPSGDATVEPDWDDARGEPFVIGVRVSLNGNGAGPQSVKLPLAYFSKAATEISRGLVAKKILQAGEKFHYSVVAFRTPKRAQPKTALALTVEEVASPLAVKAVRSSGLLEGATAFGAGHPEDVTVFIPQKVLDDAATLTRAAAADETAGILIGHVCRDPQSRALGFASHPGLKANFLTFCRYFNETIYGSAAEFAGDFGCWSVRRSLMGAAEGRH